MRACWTWNQDRRRQRATASRIGRSAAEIVSGVACRPRMGSLRGGPAFSIAAAPNVLQDFVAGPLGRRPNIGDGAVVPEGSADHVVAAAQRRHTGAEKIAGGGADEAVG